MYLHLCSCVGESCTFIVLFASILPGRRSIEMLDNGELNFLNRELLIHSLNAPICGKRCKSEQMEKHAARFPFWSERVMAANFVCLQQGSACDVPLNS